MNHVEAILSDTKQRITDNPAKFLLTHLGDAADSHGIAEGMIDPTEGYWRTPRHKTRADLLHPVGERIAKAISAPMPKDDIWGFMKAVETYQAQTPPLEIASMLENC